MPEIAPIFVVLMCVLVWYLSDGLSIRCGISGRADTLQTPLVTAYTRLQAPDQGQHSQHHSQTQPDTSTQTAGLIDLFNLRYYDIWWSSLLPAGPIEIWSVFTVGIVFVNDHSLCVITSHLFIPCLHCYCFPLQITTKKENKITNLTRGRHLYPVLVFPIWCPQLILDVSPPLFMAPPLLLAGVLPPWILINIETRWEEDKYIPTC